MSELVLFILNDSLKAPNLGINILIPKVEIGYNFNRIDDKFTDKKVPEFRKKYEVSISVFAGLRNSLYHGNDVDPVTWGKVVYYSCYGISATYKYQISHKSKFGIGIMSDYLRYSITKNNKILMVA